MKRYTLKLNPDEMLSIKVMCMMHEEEMVKWIADLHEDDKARRPFAELELEGCRAILAKINSAKGLEAT